MFSLFRKNVIPRRDLFSSKCSSIVKFISTDSTTHNSFAISYLINTCGVSKEKAISALKTLHFESSENPDAVITFFRDNGFSQTQISKIIGKLPLLLFSRVDKTLKPKFDCFKSQGISASDLPTFLCRDLRVLRTSLERRIIPCFDLMRSIVQTDAKLIALLKRWPRVLTEDPQKKLLPNIALLQAQGVPVDYISKLLVTQPRSFLISTSRFREIVEEVKHMKFDPSQYMFLLAVHGLTGMTRSSFEAKLDVYRGWGLSEDEVQFMFRKSPYSVMLSEKNIMSTMNYFVNKMGYTPSSIAKQPNVITYSLERRIIPRCSVIQTLKMKGLFGNDCSLITYLQLPEEVFLKKYVIKFEKEVPELLTTYQGKGR